jgi:hypothetical protein
MLDLTLGCLKWAAVGFVVAFALMKLFEASHIHDDIPKPAFKIRQTKRAHTRLIDICGNAFGFGVAARAEIGLSALDVGFWEAGLSAVALANADQPR